MVPLAHAQVHIRRPVDAVFDYAIDMERFADWFPEVVRIDAVDSRAKTEIGKEYLESVKVPLRGVRRIRLAVREVRPCRSFVTEGRFAPLLPRMELGFADRDGGTDFTFRMFSRNDSPLVRRLLLPWAARVLQRRAALGVARLKARLEGGSRLP